MEWCDPHLQRGQQILATKQMGSDWFCDACYRGDPIDAPPRTKTDGIDLAALRPEKPAKPESKGILLDMLHKWYEKPATGPASERLKARKP